MKRKTVFLKRYVAIPMLGFLPFIIGIIIFYGIWNYNENEGFRHLAAIQAKVKSEYEEADGDWRIFGNNLSTFLVRNSNLGQLLILDEDFDVIFPENELLREVRKTISEEFKIAFAEGKLGNKSVLQSSDGKTYRAALSSMKGTDSRLMYILSYSEMRWGNNNIRHLSRLVIGLSFLISLGITIMLYLYEQSAQRSAQLAYALKETIERKQQKEEKEHTLQYSINHYLQNHLMAADGYAQGMEIGVFEPDEAARKIRSENKLMEDLLLNLSFMTFMEGQTEVEQLETLYLAENVEACLEKYRSLAEEKNVQLNLATSNARTAAVGNRELVAIALDNVVSNAIRYAAETVNVLIFEEENAAVVRIEDDGKGISKTDMENIFKLMYKGRGGNTGIGLYVSRKAVELMGGTLTAENRPEGGAAFTMRMPLGNEWNPEREADT